MTTNTGPVRALIDQWRNSAENGVFTGFAGSDIRETLMECADDLEAALASAPPSAPVGAGRKYPDDGNGDDDAYNRGWNDCLDALAQQPAAVPSAPVGVERARRQAVLDLSEAARCLGVAQAKDDKGAMDYWGDKVAQCEAALSQQPAAVDAAMVDRVASALDHWDGSDHDSDYYDELARVAVEAVFAAQPGGSDNGR